MSQELPLSLHFENLFSTGLKCNENHPYPYYKGNYCCEPQTLHTVKLYTTNAQYKNAYDEKLMQHNWRIKTDTCIFWFGNHHRKCLSPISSVDDNKIELNLYFIFSKQIGIEPILHFFKAKRNDNICETKSFKNKYNIVE